RQGQGLLPGGDRVRRPRLAAQHPRRLHAAVRGGAARRREGRRADGTTWARPRRPPARHDHAGSAARRDAQAAAGPPVSRPRRANGWALVLASVGIGHRLERTLGGWQLLVGIEDLTRASGALDAYDRENLVRVAAPPPAVEYGGSHAGGVIALALFAFHAVA